MSFWKWAAVGSVGSIVLIAVTGGAGSERALGCVSPKQRYGMLYFHNTCNYAVKIEVCTKLGLSGLGEALGLSKSNWRCSERVTSPRSTNI